MVFEFPLLSKSLWLCHYFPKTFLEKHIFKFHNLSRIFMTRGTLSNCINYKGKDTLTNGQEEFINVHGRLSRRLHEE